MTHETLPLLAKRNRNRLFSSIPWKIGTLILLGLVLLIPLAQIRGLLNERMHRKAEAVREIGAQWAGSQSVYGPFLRVPVEREVERQKQTVVNGYVNTTTESLTERDHLVLLPRDFQLKAQVVPEMRYRGIFRAPVYSSEVLVSGFWVRPSVQDIDLDQLKVLWEEASLVFRVSDPKGLSAIELEGLEGDPRPLFIENLGEWVEVTYPVEEEVERIPLKLSFSLRGSESMRFMPIGRNGEARIESEWSDPSFFGRNLPVERDISKDGFLAMWQFGEFGRSIPQVWLEKGVAPNLSEMERSMSGVAFVDPVDGYRLTERSLKYGGLFIALGFVVFFLFEVLCGLRLHAMHYLLAGAAQALFFMLVLALSEVVSFHLAYLVAAAASILLITMYACSVLKVRKRALGVGGVLVALYGMLHLILKQQDYALLAGSSMLFVALAVFMYLTRKIDWGQGGSSMEERE